MVKIMVPNLIKQMDDLGGKTFPLFLVQHPYTKITSTSSRSQGHAALRRPERSERPRGVIFWVPKTPPVKEGRNAKDSKHTKKHRGPIFVLQHVFFGQKVVFYWMKLGNFQVQASI